MVSCIEKSVCLIVDFIWEETKNIMEDITNDVEKNAVVMDDPELNGLRRVAEEMAEMNNIIEKLNEQATNLKKLMRAVVLLNKLVCKNYERKKMYRVYNILKSFIKEKNTCIIIICYYEEKK